MSQISKRQPTFQMANLPATTVCTECSAGHMHREYITYLTWLADELVTVPDFPAWVCDMCGRREYDGNALNKLALILSPNAGKPPVHQRKRAIKPGSRKTKGSSAINEG